LPRLLILSAGSAEAQFDLDDYNTKDELMRAIEALPMISSSGNDITGAMRTLRTDVLSYGWRGYNNFIQKVALTLVDQRAPNTGPNTGLADAYQV